MRGYKIISVNLLSYLLYNFSFNVLYGKKKKYCWVFFFFFFLNPNTTTVLGRAEHSLFDAICPKVSTHLTIID